MAEILELPVDIQLNFLNEGAANIIYSIRPFSETEKCCTRRSPTSTTKSHNYEADHSAFYANKLLRLRKNLPTTVQVSLSHSNWLNHIAPLFHPDEILQQSLVAIRTSGIVSRLNKQLREQEHLSYHPGCRRRAEIRHGSYLVDEDYGLLITDMTPKQNISVLIEFKPKWLTQSLSAPPNSTRCRQCALNACVSAGAGKFGKTPVNFRKYCPLDLLSDDQKVITRLANVLLSPDIDQICAQRFVEWIQSSTLLHRLRQIQAKFDRTGVLNASPCDNKFLTAMTLRDCTVFMRMSRDGKSIETRLGDLDLKCTTKVANWKQTEHQLIDGGWYEGTEPENFRQPNYCFLGRGL